MIKYVEDEGVTISGSTNSILNGIANIADATFRALSENMHDDVSDDCIENALREMFNVGLAGARDSEVEKIDAPDMSTVLKLLRN